MNGSVPHDARGVRAAARRDAFLATAVLVAGIYFGSGRLAHFDSALAGYAAATLVAVFVTAYRVAAFWRRPAARFYGAALLRALRTPRHLARALAAAGRELGAQRVVARRGGWRWLAHVLLAWGTVIGFAVALPLVFGWLYFEAAGGSGYRVYAFSLPVAHFDTDEALGWLVFHLLHLAAVAVVLGAVYFLALRLRRAIPPFGKGGPGGILETGPLDKSPSIPLFQRGRFRFLVVRLRQGAIPPFGKGGSGGIFLETDHSHQSPSIPLFQRGKSRQTGGGFHLAPLLLLLAVALTGLALPLAGQAGVPWIWRVATIAHEAAVVALLAALPASKLFHVFIRPLHLGVQLARRASPAAAHCERCGGVLAPRAQVAAVEALLAARGRRFGDQQRCCSLCRRRRLAAAQAASLGAHFQPRPAARRTPARQAA